MPTQAPVGRPERAVERNRILEFSSKISFNTLKYYEPDFGLPRVPTNVAHFLHELSCQTGREPTAGLLVRYSTVTHYEIYLVQLCTC